DRDRRAGKVDVVDVDDRQGPRQRRPTDVFLGVLRGARDAVERGRVVDEDDGDRAAGAVGGAERDVLQTVGHDPVDHAGGGRAEIGRILAGGEGDAVEHL